MARYTVERVNHWYICNGGYSSIQGGVVMRKLWRLWALSLGEKLGDNNREADIVASMRSIVVLLNLVTCLFIIAGVIHNW